MSKTLTIQGMHCDACVALIKMEIEELGLVQKISELKLAEGQNQGKLVLAEMSEQNLEKIISAINNLGKYKVI